MCSDVLAVNCALSMTGLEGTSCTVRWLTMTPGNDWCRLRLAGFRPEQVSYWGVLLRVLGAAVFVLAATDNWLNQTCHVYMKRIVEVCGLLAWSYAIVPA